MPTHVAVRRRETVLFVIAIISVFVCAIVYLRRHDQREKEATLKQQYKEDIISRTKAEKTKDKVEAVTEKMEDSEDPNDEYYDTDEEVTTYIPPIVRNMQEPPDIRQRDEELIGRAVELRAKHKVLFHHPFKTGGHALCKAATLNNEKVRNELQIIESWSEKLKEALKTDPNVESHYTKHLHIKHHNTRGYNWNCEEMLQRVWTQKYTFTIMENWLGRFLDCDFKSRQSGIVTMMTIRDPVSRTASQMVQLARMPAAVTRDNTHLVAGKTPRQILESNQTHESTVTDHQVRSLVGRLPVRPDYLIEMDEWLWHDAIDTLDEVDLVIPTERLCEAYPIFKLLFGWEDSSALVQHTEFRTAKKPGVFTSFEPEYRAIVAKNMTYDVRLHEYANRRLDALLLAAGLKPRENPDCSNEIEYNIIKSDEPIQLPSVEEQNKMTEDMKKNIMCCRSPDEKEELKK